MAVRPATHPAPVIIGGETKLNVVLEKVTSKPTHDASRKVYSLVVGYRKASGDFAVNESGRVLDSDRVTVEVEAPSLKVALRAVHAAGLYAKAAGRGERSIQNLMRQLAETNVHVGKKADDGGYDLICEQAGKDGFAKAAPFGQVHISKELDEELDLIAGAFEKSGTPIGSSLPNPEVSLTRSGVAARMRVHNPEALAAMKFDRPAVAGSENPRYRFHEDTEGFEAYEEEVSALVEQERKNTSGAHCVGFDAFFPREDAVAFLGLDWECSQAFELDLGYYDESGDLQNQTLTFTNAYAAWIAGKYDDEKTQQLFQTLTAAEAGVLDHALSLERATPEEKKATYDRMKGEAAYPNLPELEAEEFKVNICKTWVEDDQYVVLKDVINAKFSLEDEARLLIATGPQEAREDCPKLSPYKNDAFDKEMAKYLERKRWNMEIDDGKVTFLERSEEFVDQGTAVYRAGDA